MSEKGPLNHPETCCMQKAANLLALALSRLLLGIVAQVSPLMRIVRT
jgi:hypothetical protein